MGHEFPRLDGETHLFRDIYYFDTTLPYWLTQRVAMPVANLASETCQWWENGRFYGWEGVGSCEGTCTHVWHYEQALGRLFPELARSIRENQNLNPSTGFDVNTGGISDRGILPGRVATDGHCGVILACLREAQMSVDNEFLKRNWNYIKLALQYLIIQDGNEDGLIENRQPNTYDISFYGANTFSGSLYLASLRAGEEMARRMGDPDFADKCRRIFESGRKLSVKRLYNGEYFIQKVDSETYPTNQYTEGCLSDQMIGQGWAHQLGLGYIYPQETVLSALRSVWKYNWAPDVGPHVTLHPPEIIYADPGEAGLLLCTWPHSPHPGERGVRYCNTVWTGIEGQVAAHMIFEGFITEGLAVLRSIHDRYNGAKHNPYNQILCGDHYARAMSSWGCLIAASGYIYDSPEGRIGFMPKISPDNFNAFFTASQGWGNLLQKREKGKQINTIKVKWGELSVRRLVFELPEKIDLKKTTLTVAGNPLQSVVMQDGYNVKITLAERIEIERNESLEVVMEW